AFPYQHVGAVQGTEVGRPFDAFQEFAHGGCGDGGDPFLIGEAIAEVAYAQGDVVVLLPGGRSYIAVANEGGEYALDGGAVYARGRSQLHDGGAAFGAAVECAQKIQSTHE